MEKLRNSFPLSSGADGDPLEKAAQSCQERTSRKGTPRWQVSRCSFLPHTFTCPHSHLRRPSPHLLWSKNRISIVSEKKKSLLLHLTSTYLTCTVQGCAPHLNIKTEAAQWPKHSMQKNPSPHLVHPVITKLIPGSSATQKGSSLC